MAAWAAAAAEASVAEDRALVDLEAMEEVISLDLCKIMSRK